LRGRVAPHFKPAIALDRLEPGRANVSPHIFERRAARAVARLAFNRHGVQVVRANVRATCASFGP